MLLAFLYLVNSVLDRLYIKIRYQANDLINLQFSISHEYDKIQLLLCKTGGLMLKNYKKSYLIKDIISGIIVAFVSIPISMGYAQVAGLPVVYGLYGSLLPILVYGFITSSPQFVFGVDAAPAALVGGTLATLGIATGSPEALKLVPVITFLVACWLFLFCIIRAGKLVNYISTPVMGGFITGIGSTIILMQVPKLYGGSVGCGELYILIKHCIDELDKFNLLSLLLGLGTIIIILVAKKYTPKVPMSVIMMIVGALITAIFKVDQHGVKLLPKVDAGLPPMALPDFSIIGDEFNKLLLLSFVVSLVIVAQTLLATNNYALRYGYKVNNNREVFAYSMGNLISSLCGCCPINGSISRTGLADQFGCKSQLMSVVASFTMLLVLMFGTGFIAYLPVPVLTGIVIAALIGILELKLARKLMKANRSEFFIFAAACAGVLVFGTVYGVVIGVVLSFIAVIIRAVIPPRAFVGRIPGHDGYYALNRNRNARPIKNTLVYRFSGTLFFANINTFMQDIEGAIKEDTKAIIVDASGIGNIDITAADRLVILAHNLKKKGIHFYLTEHVGAVNDQLRVLGAGCLLEEGVVRRTISLALRDSGIDKPYPLEGNESEQSELKIVETNERLAEFEWAFGSDADERMEQLAVEVAENIVENIAATDICDVSVIEEAENQTSWGRIGLFDEDELLDRLEMHLSEMESRTHYNKQKLEEQIELRRAVVEKKLEKLNPQSLAMLRDHRREVAEHFKHHNLEQKETDEAKEAKETVTERSK
jgi:high affinity sulfate transporter 1